MEKQANYFDILGLKPDASSEEIVSAYRALMAYWNPDRVPDYYKQKAMEGRDRIEEAYQELTGLRKKSQKVGCPSEQKLQELKTTEQPATEMERVFLGQDRDGTLFYLDKRSITVNKDKAEVAVNIYPPEGSSRLNTARGYVRRAGHEGFECVSEKWGIGLSNGVFIKYGQYYRSTGGHLVETAETFRKVWKPIMQGTLEDVAWKVIDGMMHKEKVA